MYIQNKSITVQILEIHGPDRITSLQNCQTKAKIIILFTRLCVVFTHKEDTAVHSPVITQTLLLLYLHNSHFKGGWIISTKGEMHMLKEMLKKWRVNMLNYYIIGLPVTSASFSVTSFVWTLRSHHWKVGQWWRPEKLWWHGLSLWQQTRKARGSGRSWYTPGTEICIYHILLTETESEIWPKPVQIDKQNRGPSRWGRGALWKRAHGTSLSSCVPLKEWRRWVLEVKLS